MGAYDYIRNIETEFERDERVREFHEQLIGNLGDTVPVANGTYQKLQVKDKFKFVNDNKDLPNPIMVVIEVRRNGYESFLVERKDGTRTWYNIERVFDENVPRGDIKMRRFDGQYVYLCENTETFERILVNNADNNISKVSNVVNR